MKKIITKSQEETYKMGRNFAKLITGGEVIALYGNLGAGKTTFSSGFINYFIQKKRVLSPTFIIVRHYHPKHNFIKHLIHADLYRLDNLRAIEDLGLREFFDSRNSVILIEWADKMKDLLPKKRIDIFFNINKEGSREISYER